MSLEKIDVLLSKLSAVYETDATGHSSDIFAGARKQNMWTTVGSYMRSAKAPFERAMKAASLGDEEAFKSSAAIALEYVFAALSKLGYVRQAKDPKKSAQALEIPGIAGPSA